MNLARSTRLTAARPLELGRPFAILAARLKVWAAARAEAHAARRQFSREMQQLRRFSDGELRDVGLSRSDFMSIASGTFSRD